MIQRRHTIVGRAAQLFLLLVGGALCCAGAELPSPSRPVVAPDPKIAAVLSQISSDRIRRDINALVGFGTRSTLSAQDQAAIAAGRGIGAAREWIKEQLTRYARDCGGCLEIVAEPFTQPAGERLPQPTVITNVYAVMRGADPLAAQRIVLVSGHYDSRNSDSADGEHDAPGANDDASGVAVSLECARVLSRLKFPATVIFLTVAGEEQGLFGSAQFAQMADAGHWNIEAVLNDDIVGGNRGPGQDAGVVRVFSEGLPDTPDPAQLRLVRIAGLQDDSPSRQLARYVADVGRAYRLGIRALLVFRQDRFLRGGDHESFNAQGYAAVRFTEFREDFNRQHQNVRTEGGIEYGDLPKWVDYDYVARTARLNAATLASLASAPAPPADVRILTAKLDNASTLQWSAVPGAAGYEILWRATTSPEWEHARRVAGATEATLDVSKDNVIFAVRALDAAGRRSLAVVPEPER